jgi:hypothetical protein
MSLPVDVSFRGEIIGSIPGGLTDEQFLADFAPIYSDALALDTAAREADPPTLGPDTAFPEPNIVWMGAWSSVAAYGQNSVVQRSGSAYVAVAGSIGADPAAVATSVWNSAVPAGDATDGPYTLGNTFTVTAARVVTALKYYKYAGDATVHVGRIYDDTPGSTEPLVEVTFVDETPSGWQTQLLPAGGFRVEADTTYVLAVTFPAPSHFAYVAAALPHVSADTVLTAVASYYTDDTGASPYNTNPMLANYGLDLSLVPVVAWELLAASGVGTGVDTIQDDPTGTGHSLISSLSTFVDVDLVTLAAGANITITPSGTGTLTIAGSAAGVTAVEVDPAATGEDPVSGNSPSGSTALLRGLIAGANVTITPTGDTDLTIAASAPAGLYTPPTSLYLDASFGGTPDGTIAAPFVTLTQLRTWIDASPTAGKYLLYVAPGTYSYGSVFYWPTGQSGISIDIVGQSRDDVIFSTQITTTALDVTDTTYRFNASGCWFYTLVIEVGSTSSFSPVDKLRCVLDNVAVGHPTDAGKVLQVISNDFNVASTITIRNSLVNRAQHFGGGDLNVLTSQIMFLNATMTATVYKTYVKDCELVVGTSGGGLSMSTAAALYTLGVTADSGITPIDGDAAGCVWYADAISALNIPTFSASFAALRGNGSRAEPPETGTLTGVAIASVYGSYTVTGSETDAWEIDTTGLKGIFIDNGVAAAGIPGSTSFSFTDGTYVGQTFSVQLVNNAELLFRLNVVDVSYPGRGYANLALGPTTVRWNGAAWAVDSPTNAYDEGTTRWITYAYDALPSELPITPEVAGVIIDWTGSTDSTTYTTSFPDFALVGQSFNICHTGLLISKYNALRFSPSANISTKSPADTVVLSGYGSIYNNLRFEYVYNASESSTYWQQVGTTITFMENPFAAQTRETPRTQLGQRAPLPRSRGRAVGTPEAKPPTLTGTLTNASLGDEYATYVVLGTETDGWEIATAGLAGILFDNTAASSGVPYDPFAAPGDPFTLADGTYENQRFVVAISNNTQPSFRFPTAYAAVPGQSTRNLAQGAITFVWVSGAWKISGDGYGITAPWLSQSDYIEYYHAGVDTLPDPILAPANKKGFMVDFDGLADGSQIMANLSDGAYPGQRFMFYGINMGDNPSRIQYLSVRGDNIPYGSPGPSWRYSKCNMTWAYPYIGPPAQSYSMLWTGTQWQKLGSAPQSSPPDAPPPVTLRRRPRKKAARAPTLTGTLTNVSLDANFESYTVTGSETNGWELSPAYDGIVFVAGAYEGIPGTSFTLADGSLTGQKYTVRCVGTGTMFRFSFGSICFTVSDPFMDLMTGDVTFVWDGSAWNLACAPLTLYDGDSSAPVYDYNDLPSPVPVPPGVDVIYIDMLGGPPEGLSSFQVDFDLAFADGAYNGQEVEVIGLNYWYAFGTPLNAVSYLPNLDAGEANLDLPSDAGLRYIQMGYDGNNYMATSFHMVWVDGLWRFTTTYPVCDAAPLAATPTERKGLPKPISLAAIKERGEAAKAAYEASRARSSSDDDFEKV